MCRENYHKFVVSIFSSHPVKVFRQLWCKNATCYKVSYILYFFLPKLNSTSSFCCNPNKNDGKICEMLSFFAKMGKFSMVR